MALSANAWDVRTTGSDAANSGGFARTGTGTDYSRQASPQYTATDLVVDATTSTKVTSASHSFVSADVGNVLRVTAGTGWTVGFYQVASVAGGAATLDRSPAATGTTGGSYAVGGAFASPGYAGSVMSATVGDRLNIKAGTYNFTVNSSNVSGGWLVPPAGSAGTPTIVSGYSATPGDLDPVNDFSGFPELKATAGINYFFNLSNNYCVVSDLYLNGNAVANFGMNASGTNLVLANLKSASVSTGYNIASGGAAIGFFRCHASGALIGFSLNGYVVELHGCVATGCTTGGFKVTGSYVHTFNRCIAHANTGASTDGFSFATSQWGARMVSCVASGNGRDGARFTDASSAAAATILGSIFALNGGYGIRSATTDFSGTICPTIDRNAFHSNTSGLRSQFPAGANDVTLTGDPFTASGSGDFSLNNTAGAGAACRAAGFPGVMPGASTTGYLDIGAAQHQDAGGGGTTNYIINQTINKYFVNDAEP